MLPVIAVILVMLAIGGVHFYMARRVHQLCSFLFPRIPFGVWLGVFGALALVLVVGFARSLLPIPVWVRDILKVASAYYMGVLLYLLLFLIAADVVLLAGRLLRLIPSPMPGKIRALAVLAAVLLTGVTVLWGVYNAKQLRHVSYDVTLSHKTVDSGWNIVLVSDLHLGAVGSEERLEVLVEQINSRNPDVVCISGDIFDNDYSAVKNPERAMELLGSISAKYGVYAVLGNHDAGETVAQMLRFLEACSIKVLKDECVVLDDRLVLVGRLDGSPIGGNGGTKRGDTASVLAGLDGKLPVVVMDHNPANIAEYAGLADLILSGHTHQGQVFPGNLITGAVYTVDYGYYYEEGMPHVVVTSGAGTWGPPLRVGTDCEIVTIRLR